MRTNLWLAAALLLAPAVHAAAQADARADARANIRADARADARIEDVAALIRAADGFRLSAENLRIETEVATYRRDGSLDKERAYLVYVQAGHQSLVLMQSPAEQGQKLLMRGDDFWLLMPQTQRPMRITPSQKLLGDASTGDIATLSWSEDYRGTLVGEERCGEQACLHLSLAALRPGVSYQRIELWLGTVAHEPIRAELYLQSDKLAKQARFVLDRPAAPTRVDEMVLHDELGNHKETRVRYGPRQAQTVPEAWLNPMYLARNPTLQ